MSCHVLEVANKTYKNNNCFSLSEQFSDSCDNSKLEMLSVWRQQ